jgi:hypothetical protein
LGIEAKLGRKLRFRIRGPLFAYATSLLMDSKLLHTVEEISHCETLEGKSYTGNKWDSVFCCCEWREVMLEKVPILPS